MKLTNTVVVPGLHKYLFNVTQALQKGFKLTSEGETLILKKNSTEILFDKKIVNKSGKEFILTTKFHKSTNDTTLLEPNKRKTEDKTDLQLEGTAVKKQENTTTTKNATHKVHTNKLHVKLVHPGEDRMQATAKHLHYIIKGALDICEDCATAKIK